MERALFNQSLKKSRKVRVDLQMASGPAYVVEASLMRMDDAALRQSSFADDAARELSFNSNMSNVATPHQTPNNFIAGRLYEEHEYSRPVALETR
jgi:hypothetical protein